MSVKLLIEHGTLDEMNVEPEDVRMAAIVLILACEFPGSLRDVVVRAGLYAAGITNPRVGKAAVARLRAAALLDLGGTTELYSTNALTEAIAFAPLHLVGDYYYFMPEEFSGLLVREKAHEVAAL